MVLVSWVGARHVTFHRGAGFCAVPRAIRCASRRVCRVGRAHSSQFGTPSGKPTFFGTTPLEYDFEEGDSFSYSSAACEFRLPFNDTSLIFRGPGYPDIESPAPALYFLEGTVTETTGSGGRGTVEGSLTIIYCEEGRAEDAAVDPATNPIEGDRIFVEYQAKFTMKSLNSLPLRGTFEITGGTGRFADISGQGSFKGELTCLPGTLDNDTVPEGVDNCAELGAFSDAAFNLCGAVLRTRQSRPRRARSSACDLPCCRPYAGKGATGCMSTSTGNTEARRFPSPKRRPK